MRNFLDKCFYKIFLFLPDTFYEYFWGHIYMPLMYGKNIKIENEAFIILTDGSRLNKMSFIDICNRNGKDWIYEMDKMLNQIEVKH